MKIENSFKLKNMAIATMMVFSANAVNASPIAISLNGNITDNTPGGTTTSVHHNGEGGFSLLSETADTEQWRFGGALTESQDPLWVPICIAIIILLLTAEDANSIGTLAEQTASNYTGSFSINDPLLAMSGAYARQPGSMSMNYTASVNEGLQYISGPLSWHADTRPTEPGKAVSAIQIFADDKGDTRKFEVTNYFDFDPSIILSHKELSDGTCNECVVVNGVLTFDGTVTTTVPEPSSWAAMVGGLAFALARRRRAC